MIHARQWRLPPARQTHRQTAVLSHGSLALGSTRTSGGPRKTTRRGYILRRLELGLMGLVLSLMLAEGALRLVHPIPEEQLLPLEFHERRLKRLLSGEAYVGYDATLGWVTARDIRQRTGDILYRHNKAGLRAEREYPPEPLPGVRRIAAFGDSYTYCHEVNFKDCWIDLLGQTWQGTETLSFGVPGYGPDQAWLRYQREGQAYKPCAVTIGFMVENINRVVNRYRPALVPYADVLATKPRFVVKDGQLTMLPNPATTSNLLFDTAWVEQNAGANDRWYFPDVWSDSPLDLFQLGRVARTAAYRYSRGDPDIDRMRKAYRPGDEAFEVTGRVLIEFARQVQRDGSAPVVVIFSESSELQWVMDGNRPHYAPLLEWLAREGIPTVDTTPDLVAEARNSGLSSVIVNHYAPGGNRVVAQTLARQLPELIGERCTGS